MSVPVAAETVAPPGSGCYQWRREHAPRRLLFLALLSDAFGGGRGARDLSNETANTPESRQRNWRLFCRRLAADGTDT
ncbi:MAG TPA: hypothetical protein VFF91_06130, partial [Pseudoxanthomonas sp.]|nr:hypothetical protein [Pseudoxanthomonas sp.]